MAGGVILPAFFDLVSGISGYFSHYFYKLQIDFNSMEREELLASLEKLRAGYIALLTDLQVMQQWGKTSLEALYATKIGKFQVELLELQIELKALKKKIQLCHQYINRNQDPDFSAIEETMGTMMHEAYEEIKTEKGKILYGKAVLSNLHSPEDSMELRKMYRNIARKLHPDVNPNLTEEQKDIWLAFKDAYDSGDLDRMKALEIVYAEQLRKSEQEDKELSEEDILLQTAMLKQGISVLEEQKRALEQDFPFNIAEQIRDEEWVEEQQNLLKKEIEDFKNAVKEQQDIYELIKETYA